MDLHSKSRQYSEPRSFREYALASGHAEAKTAPSISVDSLDALSPDLRRANSMVFRLGSPTGERHTRFGLATALHGWGDYFLLDERVFKGVTPTPYTPDVPAELLYAFTLLPAYTETSAVNLAIASALAAHALEIDPASIPSAPATGQTTNSFEVRPHAELKATWRHDKGQVEIDALFVGQRNRQETLFVLEAKCSPQFSSLAKHKLVYPILALRDHLPPRMGICPVYMRVIKRRNDLIFYFAECKPLSRESPQQCINELQVAKCSAYSLEIDLKRTKRRTARG